MMGEARVDAITWGAMLNAHMSFAASWRSRAFCKSKADIDEVVIVIVLAAGLGGRDPVHGGWLRK